MDLNNEYPHSIIPDLFIKKIEGYVGDLHLDFGCGNGWFTSYLASCSKTDIIGYDLPEKIYQVKSIFKDHRIRYTDSFPEVLSAAPFDSATLTFVLHDSIGDVIGNIRGLVHPGSHVCILDYELKGKDEREFVRSFTAELEQQEINRLGVKEAHRIHTSKGLDECVVMCEEAGFNSLKQEVVLDKYYIWVGYMP